MQLVQINFIYFNIHNRYCEFMQSSDTKTEKQYSVLDENIIIYVWWGPSAICSEHYNIICLGVGKKFICVDAIILFSRYPVYTILVIIPPGDTPLFDWWKVFVPLNGQTPGLFVIRSTSILRD